MYLQLRGLGNSFSSMLAHTELWFYNGVIKFHDYNLSKMADLVIVAAIATKDPLRAELMKCGAISKGDSLSIGILFSVSTTKANNNRLAFLWMDDANRSGFPGNWSYFLTQYSSLTVLMLSHKLKSDQIPSILSPRCLLHLRRRSKR